MPVLSLVIRAITDFDILISGNLPAPGAPPPPYSEQGVSYPPPALGQPQQTGYGGYPPPVIGQPEIGFAGGPYSPYPQPSVQPNAQPYEQYPQPSLPPPHQPYGGYVNVPGQPIVTQPTGQPNSRQDFIYIYKRKI